MATYEYACPSGHKQTVIKSIHTYDSEELCATCGLVMEHVFVGHDVRFVNNGGAMQTRRSWE